MVDQTSIETVFNWNETSGKNEQQNLVSRLASCNEGCWLRWMPGREQFHFQHHP
jgi:hypothetical protein